MRWYLGSDRKQRLWLDESEFDTITEDQLRCANLYPTASQSAVNIERFIEKHLHAAMDQYADLGENIAGAIDFEPSHIKIYINRKLTEAAEQEGSLPGVRGRWRATMAHEACHGIFHKPVYSADPAQGALFDFEPSFSAIRCPEQEIAFGGGLDWREFQANKGMASLLMPRTVFIEVAKLGVQRLTNGNRAIQPYSNEYARLIKHVSLAFEVSQQAASIRLKEVETVIGIGQPPMVQTER